MLTEDDLFTVIDKYFSEKGLVSQQKGSYDNFVRISVQQILDETKAISITMDAQGEDGIGADVMAQVNRFRSCVRFPLPYSLFCAFGVDFAHLRLCSREGYHQAQIWTSVCGSTID